MANSRPLGRRIPPNFEHADKYPLRLATGEAFFPSEPTAMVIGIDWYTNFDEPWWDAGANIWRIGTGDLGSIRGGHCVAVKPGGVIDNPAWWHFYNQVAEGKCVGEGTARWCTLKFRRRFDPTFIWNEAKKRDPWPETNPGDNEGTDVNSAMKVLKELGPCPVWGSRVLPPQPWYGIDEYRWARTVEEMERCLMDSRIEQYDAFPILNSWGNDGKRVGTSWVGGGYPHIVWLAREAMFQQLNNWAEAAIMKARQGVG